MPWAHFVSGTSWRFRNDGIMAERYQHVIQEDVARTTCEKRDKMEAMLHFGSAGLQRGVGYLHLSAGARSLDRCRGLRPLHLLSQGVPSVRFCDDLLGVTATSFRSVGNTARLSLPGHSRAAQTKLPDGGHVRARVQVRAQEESLDSFCFWR